MSNPLSSTIDVHTSTIKGTHSDCVDYSIKTIKNKMKQLKLGIIL